MEKMEKIDLDNLSITQLNELQRKVHTIKLHKEWEVEKLKIRNNHSEIKGMLVDRPYYRSLEKGIHYIDFKDFSNLMVHNKIESRRYITLFGVPDETIFCFKPIKLKRGMSFDCKNDAKGGLFIDIPKGCYCLFCGSMRE